MTGLSICFNPGETVLLFPTTRRELNKDDIKLSQVMCYKLKDYKTDVHCNDIVEIPKPSGEKEIATHSTKFSDLL